MKPRMHGRILELACADSLAGARLDALSASGTENQCELVLDYQELRLTAPPTWEGSPEKPRERVQGVYLPRRLHIYKARGLECFGLYNHLEYIPLDHPERSLRGCLYWHSPLGEDFFILASQDWNAGRLRLSAGRFTCEERPGKAEPMEMVRDWSPPPPLLPGLVPNPPALHQRYAGDPISIRLGKRLYHRRLFIGGVEEQRQQRPQVDAVLNISEEISRWMAFEPQQPGDRWVSKGEGKLGMSEAELAGEAQWVIERLRRGQRVLVHCAAGFNRSVTVCCAVLILLEGLSAEAALARVRQHHPWAQPDTRHWLALRWLARRNFDSQGEKRA